MGRDNPGLIRGLPSQRPLPGTGGDLSEISAYLWIRLGNVPYPSFASRRLNGLRG